MSDKPRAKKAKAVEEFTDLGTLDMQASCDLTVPDDSKRVHIRQFNPVQLGWYSETVDDHDFGRPATAGSAASDLAASFEAVDHVVGYDGNNNPIQRKVKDSGTVYLEPFDRVLIPTGIKLDIPTGFMVNIFPRSGTSFKKAIHLNNSVAVIDSDYTGEVFISVINNSLSRISISDGERIAQFVVTPVVTLPVVRLNETPSKSSRGAGGFGSTGV